MRVLAANWLLLAATGSAATMGLGVLMYAVPVLLLGPWAGAIADRLPAKPLITLTQLAYAGIALLLMTVALPAENPVPLINGAMIACGVLAAVEGPSLSRFGSTLIDRDHLGPALAVGSLISSGGRIVGMSLSGLLAAGIGPGPLFLFSAASCAGVIGAVHLVRPLPVVPDTGSAEVGEAAGSVWGGLRYLLRDPLVLLTLGLAFLLGSVGRNYQVTMAAMTAGPLTGGAGSYGLLSTVFAIGATVGGAFAARAGRMYGKHLVALGLGMGLLEALSGLAPGTWWFATAILPIAAIAVVVDTVVSTRLQLDNPVELRGRVLAAIGATGAIAGAVGAPLLGWLCDLLGPRLTLGLAGVVTALGCFAAAAGYNALKRRRTAAEQPDTWRLPVPTRRLGADVAAPTKGADAPAPTKGADAPAPRLGATVLTVAGQPARTLATARVVPAPRRPLDDEPVAATPTPAAATTPAPVPDRAGPPAPTAIRAGATPPSPVVVGAEAPDRAPARQPAPARVGAPLPARVGTPLPVPVGTPLPVAVLEPA